MKGGRDDGAAVRKPTFPLSFRRELYRRGICCLPAVEQQIPPRASRASERQFFENVRAAPIPRPYERCVHCRRENRLRFVRGEPRSEKVAPALHSGNVVTGGSSFDHAFDGVFIGIQTQDVRADRCCNARQLHLSDGTNEDAATQGGPTQDSSTQDGAKQDSTNQSRTNQAGPGVVSGRPG